MELNDLENMFINRFWILDGCTPRHPADMQEYVEFMECRGSIDRRRVARTELDKRCCVSTVFLPVNHSWKPGPPVLFETMVFCEDDPMLDEIQERYHTYHEAEQGHERYVRMARSRRRADRFRRPFRRMLMFLPKLWRRHRMARAGRALRRWSKRRVKQS